VYLSGKESGAHEWLIEYEKEPSDIQAFAFILDSELKSINSDYEAKRYKDMVLRPPVIRKMPADTFYRWLKSNDKLGGQHKVPRLSNDRKIVESVLSFSEKISA
jgi:hypothetical protein